MSFESEEPIEIGSHLGNIKENLNSDNRLYAICLAVDDFTLVPALDPLLI